MLDARGYYQNVLNVAVDQECVRKEFLAEADRIKFGAQSPSVERKMTISRERPMGSAGKVAMIPSQFVISTFWGKRRDEPADLAIRLNRLVDQLALIDPVLSNWIWVAERPRPVRLKTIRAHLTKEIAAAVWRANDGNPVPSKGYPFGLINSIRTDPDLLPKFHPAAS